MIVTISGLPGAGKTTVGRALAKALKYKFYSIGELRGKLAMERGLTIDELNEIGRKEKWTDFDVDEFQKEIGKKEDNVVIDSWLGFYFIPHSLKVFLKVDPDVAAERVFRDQRPDEEKKGTVKEVKKMLQKRLKDSMLRYKKYYNVDFLDKSYYDIIIDTTTLSVEEVVRRIIRALRKAERRRRSQKK